MRDDALAVIVALVTALAVTAGAVILAATAQPSTPGSFSREPTCAEWSDGCVICRRTAEGPICSMPGIACVRAEPRCVRRDGV